MAWLKTIADGLTALRLAISVALALLGPLVGSQDLNAAAALVLVAWTTDLFDGPLARKSGRAGQNWLGRSDLLIDMVLSVALLVYMGSVGLVYFWLGLAYVALWGVVIWRYGRLTKPLGAAFQGPIYVWFGLSLLARRLLTGRLMVLWVAGNVVATWGRLTRRDMPRFLRGLRDLIGNPRGSAPESERR